MKKIFKGTEPSLLSTYRSTYPNNKWVQFRNNNKRRIQTQVQLKNDQNGICAYCEIDLREKDATGESDFRVEHFHPKDDSSTSHNWNLDWNNLLGCCHGGSQRNVTDAIIRFSSHDNSCDIPKKNKNLDGVILNPLQLPAFPALFSCNRSSGLLIVNVANCQQAGVAETKAQQTICELKLDAPRLNRFRATVLNALYSQLQLKLSTGSTLEQACSQLAQAHLCKNSQQHWPAFFTSIRSYLGKEAEQHLQSIGYNG